VAQLGGRKDQAVDRIFMAAELDATLFNDHLREQVQVSDKVEWDGQTERLVAEQQRCIGALILSRKPLSPIPAAARAAALLALVRKRGLGLFSWSEELQQWRYRVQLLRQLQGDATSNPWPDVTDAGLLASLEQWLTPHLQTITQLAHFASLDLAAMLATLLPWPLPQQLEELAPARIAVPSGSRIAIDYSQQPPILAVKLQEMFGCRETPAVARGQIRLVVHLLSPARRPIQVTQDLAGFWSSSYLEVKKEMKGRYPRHQWPDNPLEAVATAKTTKPRGT
jgi:ATP-dependent helicase HrpB